MYEDHYGIESGCLLILGALFFLALFLYVLYGSHMYCGFNPKKNPIAIATVVKSQACKPIVGRGCEITIEYVYNVNGKQYVSRRVNCGSSGEDVAVVQKYPVGSEVKVYYRENNPNLSVLEPTIGRNAPLMLYVSGISFFIFSILSFVDRHVLRWLSLRLFGMFTLSFSPIIIFSPPVDIDAAYNSLLGKALYHTFVVLIGSSLVFFSYHLKRQQKEKK